MIANVSPSITTFDDTYNTLKYANRAKNIKTQVQRNVMNVQYHISNYMNIITNLKNEIVELKSQLAKKDYSLNNIVPSGKAIDPKKEELKESMKPNTSLNNPINNTYFEKCVAELKNHCEGELSLKQKIIDQQHEINNMNAILSKRKNEQASTNPSNNLFNNHRMNSENSNLLTNPNNLINMITEDLTNISPLDEKDNLFSQNINNSLISNIPGNLQQIDIYTNSNTNNNNNSSNNNLINNQKELEAKLALMKKNCDENIERFKEYVKKRDQLMNTYFRNGIKDFHFEYLQSILKAHNLKLFIIENRFKDRFNYVMNEVKENYISVLEGQLKIRDDLIKKQNISYTNDDNEKIRPLDQLKNEYSNKLPLIISHKIIKDSNKSLDLNFSNISSNNLPPINKGSLNVNTLLNDIKSINNNISKLENNNLVSGSNNKNKLKNDYMPGINSKLENQNNKLKYARNYSQGVRNLNMGVMGYNNNNIVNNINNNLNNKNQNEQSPNNHLISFIGNSPNYQNNVASANQRPQMTKVISNIPKKREKKLNINLINQKKKESHSEKSDSNNLSNLYDSYLVDLDNSADDMRIKKIKQQLRDRKSAQPKPINIKDENSAFYSPLRKEYQKNIGTILKKEADSIPQVKKKDLNVFLNEKNKSKNFKKIPFK